MYRISHPLATAVFAASLASEHDGFRLVVTETHLVLGHPRVKQLRQHRVYRLLEQLCGMSDSQVVGEPDER